jgi:hypothetical protein
MAVAAYADKERGLKSGADDLGVIVTGKPLVEVQKDGVQIGVVLPLKDRGGETIGSFGLMYTYHAGEDEKVYLVRSEKIRDQIAKAVASRGALFKRNPWGDALGVARVSHGPRQALTSIASLSITSIHFAISIASGASTRIATKRNWRSMNIVEGRTLGRHNHVGQQRILWVHMGSSLDSRDDRHAYIGYVLQKLNAFVVNLAPNAGIGDVAEGWEIDFGNELPACSRQNDNLVLSVLGDPVKGIDKLRMILCRESERPALAVKLDN